MNDIKPIEYFKGYFVSEDGKVYSAIKKGERTDLETRKYDKNNLREVKGRPAKNKYLRVYLRDARDRKRKDRFIHRLVAQAFIPNPLNKKVVHHKDGNRQNNRTDNLKWVSYKENNQDTLSRKMVERCQITGRFLSTSN